MTEEEKKIKKWSNEQKVEALAKFITLRSGDPRKALLYGFMLNCLLDEIDKRERKINKQQSELKKKDNIIDLMTNFIEERINECPYDFWIDAEKELNCNECEEDYKKCWRKYFDKKVIPEEK